MTNKGRFQSALMISAYLLLASVSQAQQNQERVIKRVNWPNEPLAIFNLQVDGKPVYFDEKFAAGEDWVKSVSFDIKNISGKVITHFEISLYLPGSRKDEPGGVVPILIHGRNPMLPGAERPARMDPGDEIHATYSDKLHEFFKRMRDLIGLKNVNQVSIAIERVAFEDNTVWSIGQLFRCNPSDPSMWVAIGMEHLIRAPSQSPVTSLEIRKGSSVTVASQPDSPMLISLREVIASDPLNPQINFQVENIGSKPIRAFSIRYDDAASKTERSGLVNDHVVECPYLRRPGQWQDIAFSLVGKSEPSERITLSVDFVEFEDGGAWGADTFKSSDRIAGRRAGFEAERTRLIKIMAQSGIDAVVKAAESGVAEPPQGHSSEWEQVFREGARVVAARVRHEFTERGAAAIEPLLKQPVTKLIYEF